VIRKLRAGMMPPPGMPQPDEPTRRNAVAWLESTLDRASTASPNPGAPLVHRLNRAEYANAIRDLLALDVNVASLLPPDDSSSGFDNNADVLGVSPVLLESYLDAAERVSALALGDPQTPPAGELFRVRQDESQDQRVDGLPLGTVGGMRIHTVLPLDGEYQFQVKLFRTNLGTMRGLEYPHQLEIAVDGERVHLASFGGDEEIATRATTRRRPATASTAIHGARAAEGRPRDITVAFIEKTHALNTRRLQSYVRSSSDTIDFSGLPHIDEVILTGPFNAKGASDTPSRQRIFICRPKTARDEGACATQILSTLARRAYRGDVTPQDARLLQTVLRARTSGRRTLRGGIDLALRRILASPNSCSGSRRIPKVSQ
jgi:hypothetical protein